MDILDHVTIYHALLLLCASLVFIYLIGCVYKCVLIYSKERRPAKGETEGVSVVITVNNRAEQIRKNLPMFLAQSHPCYEVIVVDECSEDDTQEILKEMQVHPHLRTTRIFPGTKFRNTKKLAINLGVLAAKYDIILFTEITARPATAEWVGRMESCFRDGVSAVVGYANYGETKRIDVPKFFRLEHFMETFFLVKHKHYVAGEGFNMGCRKQHYLARKVFSKNSQYYSGYDSEIVEMLAKSGSVRVVREAEAMVVVDEELRRSWGERMAYYYGRKRKWPAAALFGAGMKRYLCRIIYLTGAYMIYERAFTEYALLCMALTFLIHLVCVNIYLTCLREKKLRLTSLILATVGFAYRWCYSIYSIFTYKKWR